MRVLIVEDDITSRNFLLKFLSYYGDCDVTVDGLEALEAFSMALDEDKPYDLICLDIMMPNLDGLKALGAIRQIERERHIINEKSVKIIMISALDDSKVVQYAFNEGCEAYATKPIDTDKLVETLKSFNLIN